MPHLPVWLAALASLASGVLLGLAFAPFRLWPSAILAVAMMILAIEGRRGWSAVGLGLLTGLSFNAITVSWVGVLGWYVAVGLVTVMSLWFGLLGWLLSRLRQLPAWPVWTASSWSLMELGASSVPFDGFGWTRLAYTTADQPLSGFLRWVGVSGVSWLVALSGALLAHLLCLSNRRAVLASLLAGVFIFGEALKFIPFTTPSRHVTIAVVQGDVDGLGYRALGAPRAVTQNHLSETIMMAAKARTGQIPVPDFVLWPENSTDADPFYDAETSDLVGWAVALADRPILVGAITYGPGEDERQTTSLWWDPVHGAGARYAKRNLVPFGEWIPYRDFLVPRFPVLRQVGRQGVPGTEPGVISVAVSGHPQLRLGDVICYELIYDETVYDTVRHGAQIVLTQSSLATQTGTSQPAQQFEITRVRAMELGREVVVSTTNSFSGLVNPDGSVQYKTTESTATSLSFQVGLRHEVSLGVFLQPYLTWSLASLAMIGVVLGGVFPPRARLKVSPETGATT